MTELIMSLRYVMKIIIGEKIYYLDSMSSNWRGSTVSLPDDKLECTGYQVSDVTRQLDDLRRFMTMVKPFNK